MYAKNDVSFKHSMLLGIQISILIYYNHCMGNHRETQSKNIMPSLSVCIIYCIYTH